MSGMPVLDPCGAWGAVGIDGLDLLDVIELLAALDGESIGPSPVSSHFGSILGKVSIIFDTHRLDISVPLFIHLEITPLEQPICCSNALILMPSSFIIRAILSEIFSIVEKF